VPKLLFAVALFAFTTIAIAPSLSHAQTDQVIAFWGWESDYDFTENPNKQDFLADVDNTVSGAANLQAFLGDADELDDNGGGGWETYVSPTSGVSYGPSRTLKFDDVAGGGDDFDIGGVNSFLIDKSDGAGPLADDFGNDGLMYITLDTTGYSDIRYRFAIESTPLNGDGEPILATSYDLFYRVGGVGTWFRDAEDNNVDITDDYVPFDDDNSQASLAYRSINDAISNQSFVEIIISDFNEFGNGELEIDNIEFIGVPEPSSLGVLGVLATAFVARRRR
jgi:hypothetical protein